MSKLAIFGGKPIRTKSFPAYNPIGKEEIHAVQKVLKTGVLSKFLGCWDKLFYGGPQIQALEKEWAKYFKVKYAIAVNSCTSGLYCALGAAGIGPGDEVIVSPYTMSATATSILVWNAIPVFADIEEDYFCLDASSVEKRITKYTKAIVVTDIFGQPYDIEKINALAKKYKLSLIEDCAQAPGAKYNHKFAGTLGSIGIFSLNYHKHIHTGEGGMVVTDSDRLAEKIRLIRNHAEAVVGGKGSKDLINMVGFNFRMTEIEAAIARCQLEKLNNLIKKQLNNAEYLKKRLTKIPGLTMPKVRKHSAHVYYGFVVRFDENIIGITRDKFVKAIQAELPVIKLREEEGVRIGAGYVKPLYLEPIYQKQIAFGNKGCPFKCPWYRGKINYKKGLCPVCEKLQEKEIISVGLMHPGMSKKDLDDVIKAFEKIYLLRHTIQ